MIDVIASGRREQAEAIFNRRAMVAVRGAERRAMR
jgi:hypothetical protein